MLYYGMIKTSLFTKPNLTDMATNNILVFDIETVPVKMPEIWQQERINKKMDQWVNKQPIPIQDIPTEAYMDEERKQRSLDPFLSRVACIGLHYPDVPDTTIIIDEDERKLLNRFWATIAGFHGVFVSFNGTKFDIPFILKRSMLYDIEPTNSNFLKYTAYNPLPVHCDTLLQLVGKDSYISLDHACHFFGIQSPKEGDLAANGVAEAFEAKEWNKIKEYCTRDLIATSALYNKIKNYALKT